MPFFGVYLYAELRIALYQWQAVLLKKYRLFVFFVFFFEDKFCF